MSLRESPKLKMALYGLGLDEEIVPKYKKMVKTTRNFMAYGEYNCEDGRDL